ncbi:MarR family winged helix-turn-helix transcriptional regulator [Blastococcus sp. SYSU DS0753]
MDETNPLPGADSCPPAALAEAGSDSAEDVRWLTAEEESTWRSLMTLMTQLPWALECQLQRDAQLSVVEYHVLAMLSERPEHTMRMSELAALTNASLSRLSHLVKRLEGRGFVRREPDPADGRYTHAILTDDGYSHLAANAPGHVRQVRDLVMDALTPEQVHALGDIVGQVLARVGRAVI